MSSEKRNFSSFSMMVLWFGASISIAEVVTGASLAPLGFKDGFLSILIGHFIGAIALLLAGLIGAKSGLSATQSFRISFGKYGSYVFSILNILQLLGWTSVMIILGSQALDGISKVLVQYENARLWVLAIGALILIWISFGIKAIFKIHTFVVIALFICFIVLAYKVFTGNNEAPIANTVSPLTFSQALELSIAMCLSWLPLISDYTKNLINPVRGTILGVLCYVCGGMIMFTIGLGAALYTGTSEISSMLLGAGLGLIGLFIISFSTVTNTFLDAHSAGISASNINGNVNQRIVGMAVVITATIVALFVSMDYYIDFLTMISSVFAPLFSILLVDFFIFKRKSIDQDINVKNIVLWIIGFVLYHKLIKYNFVIGSTIPVMITIALICFLSNLVLRKK